MDRRTIIRKTIIVFFIIDSYVNVSDIVYLSGGIIWKKEIK